MDVFTATFFSLFYCIKNTFPRLFFMSWSSKTQRKRFRTFLSVFNIWHFYSSTLELQNALVLHFFTAQKRLCHLQLKNAYVGMMP